MTTRKLKIDWLVPTPIRGSGGHRTIFAHVRDLVARGHECVLHVQQRDPHVPGSDALDADGLAARIREYFFETGARVVAGWDALEPCDIQVATLWETAYFVQRSPHGRRKAYFVQDFEAWFSPMGDGWVGAENTYRLGLEHVTIGRFLTHLIRTEYQGSANFFDFTVDQGVYRPAPDLRTEAPSVAFLYQPEKPRRCPWLGREALGIVKHRMPEARIFLYGSDAPAPELWFETERLGLVTPAQCSNIYQRAHVGLCISATNPSRIPFEMMASGCAVVDLDRPNNRHDYEPGAISLAPPTPEGIAERILELLRSPSVRQRQVEAGLAMMAQRPEQRAFDQVEEHLLRLHTLGSVTVPSAGVPGTAQRDAREVPRQLRAWARAARDQVRARIAPSGGARRTASYATLESAVRAMSAGKKVVGFDVFDTLLVRRVEPDVIKEMVARRLGELLAREGQEARPWQDLLAQRQELELTLCRANQRSGLDDEFRYEELLVAWLAAAGVPSARRPALARALRACEEEVELAAQEPHPALVPLLTQLKREGKRLVFVSDFYLPVEALWRFLRAAGLASFFSAGYASSQDMLRKASGRLFGRVLAAEGISPADLLFIGDNAHSDVARTTEQGIDAVHLVDAEEKKRRLQLDLLRSMGRKNAYWRGALAHEIATNSVWVERGPRSESHALGLKVAPAFTLFAEHVLERALRDGVGAVYFCAREGATFYRMVRRLARRLGVRAPALHYVGVSRRATFLPSLGGLTLAELGRFLRQYGRLSGRQLLDSLGLPVDEFGPLLERAGFPGLDVPVEQLLESAELARFVEDPEVQERFRVRHAEARGLLADYLRQHGYFAHEKVLFVDIGWKGSIIDNVVRATGGMPGAPRVEGLLFGAQEDISDAVCPKRGYFFHGPDRDPIAAAGINNVAIFEMYATANHGSTVGYARRGARVRPVTLAHPEEREAWRQGMRDGQRAIRDWFRAYLRVRPLLATAFERSPDEWRPYYQEQIRRLIQYPSRGDVRAFMRSAHVESFGVVSVRRFATERPTLRDKQAGNRLVPSVDELYRAARFTVWPAAMLDRMNVGFLQPVYDLYDTWHRAHKW